MIRAQELKLDSKLRVRIYHLKAKVMALDNETREASYHKYWDVTDPRSPMGANSAGRFIRRYIYGDLRSVEEIKRDEEAAMGIYRRGSNS